MRLSDERIAEIDKLYKELGSVWAVGKVIGRCGQSVHEILERNGLIKKMNIFSEADYSHLKENFLSYRSDGRLEDLAKEMRRTKQFICRKAKDLGLTSVKRVHSDSYKAKCKERCKDIWKKHPHPKGMLGKNHTIEYSNKISDRVKKAWADPNNVFNTEAHREGLSERMAERQKLNQSKDANYSRTKKGWFLKNGQYLAMRSSWELNYAHYLNYLQSKGKIAGWEYEPVQFKFAEFLFGCRTYTPDFRVVLINEDTEFHEVKGWMDPKSKLKLSLFKTNYPDIKLRLIDEKKYKKIEKTKDKIPGWGTWITQKPI